MAKARTWWQRYALRLTLTDGLVLAWALAGAHVIRFGIENPEVSAPSSVTRQGGYLAVSLTLWIAWMAALSLTATRDRRTIGAGPEEYRRLLSATFLLFGGLAIIAFAFQLSIARGYLLIAFPIGLVGLVTSRWLWRQYLYVKRRSGIWLHRAVVVGDTDHARELTSEMTRAGRAGFAVVGRVDTSPASSTSSPQSGIPVVNGLENVRRLVDSVDADAVAVAAGSGMPPQSLRRLGWALEGIEVDLLVSPALTDVAGPRIHIRPVAGLPLLHVEPPEIPRFGRVVKAAFDRSASFLLLGALSPVLLVAFIAVRLTSEGPALYGQERVGLDGQTFRIWKFRSMVMNADAKLQQLLAHQQRSSVPLFKVDADPRITRAGRFLRKYSIDELPQLFNVLRGEMSLVGPRPQRPAEVEMYDATAVRRLRSKPGMTGLWQVSGRSNLSWEESVRLDLYYVENWSFNFDLVLLWRTFAVVARGEGAV